MKYMFLNLFSYVANWVYFNLIKSLVSMIFNNKKQKTNITMIRSRYVENQWICAYTHPNKNNKS